MNHLPRPTTLALLAVLWLVPAGLSAGDAPAVKAAPAVINSCCPMEGKAVDAATAPTVLVTVGEAAEAKQFRIAMCSAACCTEFMKDPAAVLKPQFGKFAPGPKTNFK